LEIASDVDNRLDFKYLGGAKANQNLLFFGGDKSNAWKMDSFSVQADKIYLEGNLMTNSIVAKNKQGKYADDFPTDWHGGIATWDINANSVQLTNFTQRSDIRLKKDISSLNINEITEKLTQIKPVAFYWKDNSSNQNLQFGFIAQEVAPVFPNLVNIAADPQKTQSLNYNGFIPLLTVGYQEQEKKIEALTREIKELKQVVEELKND